MVYRHDRHLPGGLQRESLRWVYGGRRRKRRTAGPGGKRARKRSNGPEATAGTGASERGRGSYETGRPLVVSWIEREKDALRIQTLNALRTRSPVVPVVHDVRVEARIPVLIRVLRVDRLVGICRIAPLPLRVTAAPLCQSDRTRDPRLPSCDRGSSG